MNIFFKIIMKTYLGIFLLRPKIVSTIIFIPILYLLGWFLANPLTLLGLNKEKVSLIGTIFTFILFIISMPKWFEVRWGLLNTWSLLGVNKINKNANLSLSFLRGCFYSIVLIIAILIPIMVSQLGIWSGNISIEILVNAIILIMGVGFAEEIIFRGWLLEELKNQFGLKKAIIFQGLIFSLAHFGFGIPFWQMISILFGLFLLGILLALIRLKDDNSLWGCIGLHGGLVGLWFMTNNGLIEISKDAPIWLVGPGNINTNPLGGFLGILLLLVFCFLFLVKFKK